MGHYDDCRTCPKCNKDYTWDGKCACPPLSFALPALARVPFNKLTPAQAERLDILAEECAEVVIAISKIKRHGYNTCNPEWEGAPSNRSQLEIELGHVIAAMHMLSALNDIDLRKVDESKKEKTKTIGCWMHHREWCHKRKQSTRRKHEPTP